VGEFGDTFRKEREKKGISLEDVSHVTKISARMLRAIEEEHFEQLPGGVFNKGFVRTYAKHLGLNDDEAVANYLACVRQAQLDAQNTWDHQARHAGQGGSSERGMKSPRLQEEELPGLQLPRAEHVTPPRRDYSDRRGAAIPWRLLALVILVVVLTAILLHRNTGSARPQAATSSEPVVTPAPQPAPPAAISPAPVAPAPPRQPSAAPPVPAGSSAMSRPSSTSAQPTVSAPVKPAAGTAAISNKSAELQNPELSATSATPLTLVIRASEDSWISVSADGESVLHETLIAPAQTTVHAARRIVLRVGNAAGVSFVWNGQEIPAQGVEGEVKALVFDGSGTQVVSPPPVPVQNP